MTGFSLELDIFEDFSTVALQLYPAKRCLSLRDQRQGVLPIMVYTGYLFQALDIEKSREISHLGISRAFNQNISTRRTLWLYISLFIKHYMKMTTRLPFSAVYSRDGVTA